MPNEKYKSENRNPYDLVRLHAGDGFDIFKPGFGSNRLYDHRIRKHNIKKRLPKDSTDD